MVDFVFQNMEWLFSGIGVSALTAVFLLARYVVLRSRRAVSETTSPKVDQNMVRELISISSVNDQCIMPRYPPDRYSSHPSPKDIATAIEALPPFQATKAEKNFIGLHIKWDVMLSLVHKSESDKVVLSCDFSGYSRFVSVVTSLSQYPEIKIFKLGQKLTVYGTISGIEPSGPQVEAQKLEFRRWVLTCAGGVAQKAGRG